ncbi:hypothetical protein HH310_00365 [Actinoplanes sp. TBRC 11911]|nr:hypothetical protein [Actinoplanes sp. TBRC 11911]NMO49658.1 hypothetical protein [Actinoplanes sp. TBRC 11911]
MYPVIVLLQTLIRHVAKRGKNRDETVATWTDLLVFVMVALGAIGTF